MTDMTAPITSRPTLDEHDFATVRQLYTEAQNWTRHYEQLIVNANVLIVSAALIFVGLAFGDKVSSFQARIILAIPVLMSVVGIVLTQTLFNLYAACIKRLIRLENLLGCFDSAKYDVIDHAGSLLSPQLIKLPVTRPTSVRFFLGLHALLICRLFLPHGAQMVNGPTHHSTGSAHKAAQAGEFKRWEFHYVR